MSKVESPFMVSYPTSIVSNIVSRGVEYLMQKFCDLDLGRFKVKGHGASR